MYPIVHELHHCKVTSIFGLLVVDVWVGKDIKTSKAVKTRRFRVGKQWAF